MNDVQHLNQHNKKNRLKQILTILNELKISAQPEFKVFVSKHKILGEWDDKCWKYKNRNLYFTKPFDTFGNLVTSTTKAENKVVLEGAWAEIIRLYTLIQIKKGKTSKAVATSFTASIWLAESVSYDQSALYKIKQSTLDNVIPILEKYFNKRGPFARYQDIVGLTRHFLIPNKLVIGFALKTNMKNPALNQIDITTDEYEARREQKYEVDIDKYLGKVKQRFDAEREREKINETLLYPKPKPLYDELRLLASPFMLAFGFRVGELCRLSEDCLQFDEVNERWYITPYTEKGELPSAKPVPRMWQEIIVEAYKRIKKLTQEHRKFAKQVESLGEQAFINVLSFESRPQRIIKAIIDAGYDPELHFTRSEIGETGDAHLSGLTYNRLRRRYISGLESSIKCEGQTGKNIKLLLYSKKKVAALAMSDYELYRQSVYKENLIDSDEQGSISSSSFNVELPFSKFLFIAMEDTFNAAVPGQGFIPKPLTSSTFTNWISDDKGSRNITCFQRYDIKDDNGNIVSINSHQFRHWLTTALMGSGKNEMMVDIYMGRKPGQARHYDHRTSKQRAEAIRSRYLGDAPPDDVLGRRIKRMRDNDVPYEEIETALNHTLSVVHYTPWGTCKRDLDVSPCEKGMMCLRGDDGKGCEHFGIDPNDLEAKQSILNTKTHYENQLSVLLPNYQNLMDTLNKQEPLDQHIQYCIDTIHGCEFALRAYDNAAKHAESQIDVVQVFVPKKVK